MSDGIYTQILFFIARAAEFTKNICMSDYRVSHILIKDQPTVRYHI